MQIPRTNILGVRVDLVDLSMTLQIADEFIASRKTHQIVVVNVTKVVKAQKDVYLKNIINNSNLSGADGVPLLWISPLFGGKIPGRVNGTDLMEELVARSAEKGYRIFFFGAEEEIVKKVVDIYLQRYPTLQIAGYHNGYFKPEDEENIARQIGESNADILFVAFGTPKKEYFIAKYKHIMQVPLIHGVGGSFDVLAGKTRRAPLWMQKNGLEWFYRFLQEPSRMWKRYFVINLMFIWYLILKILHLKKFTF